MTIASYSDLKTAVADWLERADSTTVARIPDFITLTESKINRALNIRAMETDASLTATAGARTIALPTGFREPQALWIVIDGDRRDLRPVIPELIEAASESGEPTVWCVDGSNIAFERPCDQAYSFVLREMVGLALSDAVPTNLVLANHPDLYLWGAVYQAGLYLRDNDLINTAKGLFDQALEEAQAKEAKAKSMAPLVTEVSRGALGMRSGFDIRTGR